MKGDSMIVTQRRALINNPWAQQLLPGLGSTGLCQLLPGQLLQSQLSFQDQL